MDGILVTMPHQFTAFAHCPTSSERAKMLRVVSVIRRNPDGTWHGDMLDGLALLELVSDLGQGRVSAGPPDPTGCDLVCNATPMGMEDGDPTPLRSLAAHLPDVRG